MAKRRTWQRTASAGIILFLIGLIVTACDGDETATVYVPALTPNPAQIAQTITALAILLTPGAVPPTPPITSVLTTPTPSGPTYSSYTAWWQRHGGVAIAQPAFTPVAGLTPYVPQTAPTVPNLPPPPARMEDYPQTLITYLSKLPDAKPGDVKAVQAGAAQRLKEALQGWRAIGPEGVISVVDLDRNGMGDIVATAWQADPKAKILPSSTTNPPGIVFVLRGTSAGWTPSIYNKGLTANANNRDFVAPLIFQAGQISKSGQIGIAFTETACGPQNCIDTVHVIAPFVNGAFRELTPNLPTMAYPAISFADRDGNGDLALLLRGNIWPASNAGLQRERTDIYRWDVRDLVYKLSETVNAPSPFLYYTVLDANTALGVRSYAQAIRLYTQALTDDNLKLWQAVQSGNESAGQPEQQALRAFARFRLALTQAITGDSKSTLATLNDASRLDGEYAGWARAFLGVYNTTGGVDPNRYSFDPAFLFPTIVVPTSPVATDTPPIAPPTPTVPATNTRPAPKTTARPPQTTPAPPTTIGPTVPSISTPPPAVNLPTITTSPGPASPAISDGTGIGLARPLSLSPLLKSACQAAIRYSSDHPDLIAHLNQFGPTNPFFTTQDICPPFS